ncbi:MAG: amidase [Burkholderiaceae bacterium]
MTTPIPADQQRRVLHQRLDTHGDDLSRLDASSLSAGYVLGLWTPTRVVEAFLRRIAARNDALHAYVDVWADDALKAARAATLAREAGHAIGPLHGLPIALKDLIEIEGRVCTAGSPTRRAYRALHTATLARRLLAHGMIVLGKTHTVEFAFGAWGTNEHLGTPRNPWDDTVHRTPGGSSSGSGVAVAARLAPWAIGTDTGGSVRIPAAFNGLTGLKVTYGRLSNHGICPLSPSLDTPGPIARSVVDAATLFNAMQGEDPLDPATQGIVPVDALAGLDLGVAGLRLGRLPEADRAGFQPETLAAYDAALVTLAGLGAQIVPVTLPMRLSSYTAASAVMHGESYALYGALADDDATPMDRGVRARIRAGAMPVERYLQAQWARQINTARFLAAIADVDALLTPTTTTAAIPVADVDESTTAATITRFVNQLGLCALALPCGFTAQGLPLSLQIVCRGFAETLALRVGQAFQQATRFHLREPAGL